MDINPEAMAKDPFVIAFIGSFVSLKWAPGDSFLERLTNVASGTAIGGYVSPTVAAYFGLVGDNGIGATSFLLGLFGLNLVAATQKYILTTELASLLPGVKRGDK